MRILGSALLLFTIILLGPMRLKADTLAVAHPFMLWTPAEAATIRQNVQNIPWMQAAYQSLLKDSRGSDQMRLLFRYAVMEEPTARTALKQDLMNTLNSAAPLGGAIEQQILSYDVLYNSLTPTERQFVETKFREYIAYSIPPGSTKNTALFNDAVNYSRYDVTSYTKTNWLPNIAFPRKISANLMALALRDEKLIRETWAVHGSLKYYFDDYLSDKGFYSEEIGKMTSTPGALFYYCIAAKNLGLNELGFGYVGKNGATMRGHIETIIDLTYPKVDLGTSRPQWPQITSGDLRDYPPFQHVTVEGYFSDSSGGNDLWTNTGAWGGPRRGNNAQWDADGGKPRTDKMTVRLWFELGHKFWPDSKFDYFLVQMRAPNEDKYYPSLYFGLEPIDPANVSPPPAPSAIWPQRGFVTLRFDESPAYWESKAPAVFMRLATPYAHSVYDNLAINGFYALNRPFYLNPHINQSYASGYSLSIKSHTGVSVDANKPGISRSGTVEPNFTDKVTTTHDFNKNVKLITARTSDRYPGVTEVKSLFLTKEYMFEVSDQRSDTQHAYLWTAYAIGNEGEKMPTTWNPSTDLGTFIPELSNVSAANAESNWSVVVRQTPPTAGIPIKLGTNWFDHAIGIRISMLGQPGMLAYTADAPKHYTGKELMKLTPVLAKVENKNAQFVALHEPFENAPEINNFNLIEKTDDAIAVNVSNTNGGLVNDRLMLVTGNDSNKVVTLGNADESFTFSNFAYLRVRSDSVKANGNIAAINVKVDGKPILVLNGKIVPSSVTGGKLTYMDMRVSVMPAAQPQKLLINLYPNPTSGVFNVHMSGLGTQQTASLLLYNTTGQLIWEQNNKNPVNSLTQTIDLTGYAKGIYILKIKTNEGTQVKRIVFN